MELQTLASVAKYYTDQLSAFQQRLRAACPLIFAEDLVLMSILLTSSANLKSLSIGAGLGGLGLLLLIWINLSGPAAGFPSYIGPYRFVRYPACAALWVSSVGLCLAARSFPALLLTLTLLPWLYYTEIKQDEIQPRRRDLAAIRYRFFVPALLPNFLPYKNDQKIAFKAWNWRYLWQGFKSHFRPQVGRLLIGWCSLSAAVLGYLPAEYLWMFALAWLALICLRLILLRFQPSLRF